MQNNKVKLPDMKNKFVVLKKHYFIYQEYFGFGS